MRKRYSKNREKIIVDDVITLLLVVMFAILAIFFKLIALMSLLVYPIFSLLIYGILKLILGIFKIDLDYLKKILYSLLGIISIAFSLFIINLIFFQSVIPSSYIVYFIAIPIAFIGLAGIMKGIMIKAYAFNSRLLNVIIGITTLIITYIAFFYTDVYYLFNMIALFTVLILNAIFRSALYLSEYKLSLKDLRNLKYVFVIINNFQLEDDNYEDF